MLKSAVTKEPKQKGARESYGHTSYMYFTCQDSDKAKQEYCTSAHVKAYQK